MNLNEIEAHETNVNTQREITWDERKLGGAKLHSPPELFMQKVPGGALGF